MGLRQELSGRGRAALCGLADRESAGESPEVRVLPAAGGDRTDRGEQGKDSENFDKFLKLIDSKHTNVIKVKAGDKIVIDKYCNLEIVFPDSDLIKQNILNNNSIVSKFNFQKYSILFTGDIEKVAEEKIIRKYKETEKLKSNILKVAHHGSKSSSIQQFLEMVKPEIALIGVGEKNTFGHPNGEVLERLNELRL